MEQHKGIDYVYEELSKAIHVVERELHVFVDDNYPIMKFFNQLEEIKTFRDKEAKELDKHKR